MRTVGFENVQVEPRKGGHFFLHAEAPHGKVTLLATQSDVDYRGERNFLAKVRRSFRQHDKGRR